MAIQPGSIDNHAAHTDNHELPGCPVWKGGGYFKATKPNVVNPHAVSANGNKSRTVSRDMAIQPGSIENHAARTDNHEAPQPPQSRIDPSAYVDATATSEPQVELELRCNKRPQRYPPARTAI
ncbi:hypothetical protein HDV62DRAFT_392648 [Trichoderma sp. SZMC 28011]